MSTEMDLSSACIQFGDSSSRIRGELARANGGTRLCLFEEDGRLLAELCSPAWGEHLALDMVVALSSITCVRGQPGSASVATSVTRRHGSVNRGS